MFFLILIIAVAIQNCQAFLNCTNLHPECVNFTYTSYYYENIDDRLESLNRYLNDYLYPNNFMRKKVKFVKAPYNDYETYEHIFLQAEEDIDLNEVLFAFGSRDSINSFTYSHLLMTDDFAAQHPSHKYRWFELQFKHFQDNNMHNHQELIFHLLLHIGYTHKSVYKDYLKALRTDIHAPIIQFDDQEIQYLKSIDEAKFQIFQEKRQNYKGGFDQFSKNFYWHSDRNNRIYYLNYTEDSALKFADYVWAKYLLETRTSHWHGEEYFIPGLEYMLIDYDNDFVEHDEIEQEPSQPENAVYRVKRAAKKGDIIRRPKIYDLHTLFVYEGKLDPKREQINIPLWAQFTDTFKTTQNHVRLWMYIPFGNHAIEFSNTEASELHLRLVSRILSMNNVQASQCLGVAASMPKSAGKLKLFQKMDKDCAHPIIINDIGEYALPEIKFHKNKINDALYKINKTLRKLQIKQDDKCTKHLNLIKKLAEIKLGIYEKAEEIVQDIQKKAKEQLSQIEGKPASNTDPREYKKIQHEDL